MNEDKNDMVAIVAHMTRIASRRRGMPMPAFMAAAPELIAAMCVALGLDDGEVAMLARQQAAAMIGGRQ